MGHLKTASPSPYNNDDNKCDIENLFQTDKETLYDLSVVSPLQNNELKSLFKYNYVGGAIVVIMVRMKHYIHKLDNVNRSFDTACEVQSVKYQNDVDISQKCY